MALTSKQNTGAIGEKIAGEFLRRRGFKLIESNYRKPWGEIDIIAEKGNVVRFVEVKSVSRDTLENVTREINTHRPEEMVTKWKLEKLARTVELYMESKKDKRDFQIDVIAVFLDQSNKKARCRFYEQVL